MEPQVIFDTWYDVDTNYGTYIFPTGVAGKEGFAPYVEGARIQRVIKRKAYGARWSMRGYLGCTDWSIFDSELEAWQFLEGDCDDDDPYYDDIVAEIRRCQRPARLAEIEKYFTDFFQFSTSDYNGEDNSWSTREYAEPDEDISWSELTRAKDIEDDTYAIFPYSSGSDYDGSTVEMANYRVIKETDFAFHELTGSYGSYGLCFRVGSLLDSSDDIYEEIIDVAKRLAEYPIIDEDKLCQVEMELIDEAWECWARRDFERAVEKRFECEVLEISINQFNKWAYELGFYWEADGPSMHIDVERVADRLTAEQVRPLAKPTSLWFGANGVEYGRILNHLGEYSYKGPSIYEHIADAIIETIIHADEVIDSLTVDDVEYEVKPI